MSKDPEYRPLVPKDVPYAAIGDSKEPDDKYNAGWFIFLILGVGLLLPWNAFLNAGAYFTSIYPEFPSFIFFLSLVYNWSGTLTLFASIKIMPRFSIGSRIITCFVIDLMMLLAVPFINNIFSNASTAIAVTYVATFLTGMATSVLFGTVFGLSALFPPHLSSNYAAAIMSGNGIAGVLCSVLSILTQAVEPNTKAGHRQSGLMFFSIASATIVICIASYIMLMRLPITIYYLRRYNNSKDITETERLVNGNGHRHYNDDSSSTSSTSADASSGAGGVSAVSVFKKIWLESSMVWSVFFVSLALFPGITSLIKSPPGLQSWFFIIIVTIFTVGDYIGRTLPKWFLIFKTARQLVLPVVLRYVFFILLPLCIKPLVFHSQWVVYTIMAIFAVTNGYLGTLAMMFGPTKASMHEKETAGFIMTFSLNFGIFCGVHFAFLLLYLLTGSIGVHL